MFINKGGKHRCTADEFSSNARCIYTSDRTFSLFDLSHKINLPARKRNCRAVKTACGNAPCDGQKFISRATVFTPFVYKHLQDGAQLWSQLRSLQRRATERSARATVGCLAIAKKDTFSLSQFVGPYSSLGLVQILESLILKREGELARPLNYGRWESA